MLPLLVKDGLAIVYVCSTLIFLTTAIYYYSTTTTDKTITFWPTLPFPSLSKLVVSSAAQRP